MVSDVHENLGTFTCLAVFVGDIVVVDVVADVEEVSDAGFLDTDLLDGDVE